MNVKILSVTNDAIETIYRAFRVCYSKDIPSEIEIPKTIVTEYESMPDYGKMIEFIKDKIDKGHYSPLEHCNITFAIEGISRACYDNKTEIYTENGWKLFNELQPDDKVLTLNPITKECEFQQPNEFVKYYYNGVMHKYKSQNVDLVVTPNHKLYMKKYDVRVNQDFELMASENIDVNRIRMSKHIKNNSSVDEEIIINGYQYERKNKIGKVFEKNTGNLALNREKFYKLLAWYLSEGSIYHNQVENSYTISISQENSDKNLRNRKEIISLIRDCGFTPTSEEKGIKFKSLTMGKFLKKLGASYDKYIPFDLFKNFNNYYAKIFIDTYSKADASIDNTGHIKLYTVSPKLAEQLQMLCFIAGHTASLWVDDRTNEISRTLNGIEIKHNYPCYVISISKGDRNTYPIIKKNKHFVKESYNDFVYCVEVPNHIIFIRRNGIALWCGNCSHQLVRHRTFKFSQQSQRYVDGKNFDFIIPESLKDGGYAEVNYKDCLDKIWCLYNSLIELGYKKEDARYLLPNATTTNLIVTCDLRNFRNFLAERLCKNAQTEIRELAEKMLEEVEKEIPFIRYKSKKCGRTCFECYKVEGSK